ALGGEAHRISRSKYRNPSIELLEVDNLRSGTGPLGYWIWNEIRPVRTAGCRKTRGPSSLGPQHHRGAADKRVCGQGTNRICHLDRAKVDRAGGLCVKAQATRTGGSSRGV